MSTEKKRGRPKVNPTGRKYGKWTVLGINVSSSYPTWICICDPERGGCGSIVHVFTTSLYSGKSTQCDKCCRNQKKTEKKD